MKCTDNEIMLKVENVGKEYMLGTVSGATLKETIKERYTKKNEKKYNRKFRALEDVSFELKKGEAVGLIGSNGAGKSTLLKLISRITAPTTGCIYLNGRVASMLEVGTGFHQELTGRENIYLNGSILGMTKKEIDIKLEKIIEFSECQEFIDTPVKRYSSGMYVKLAFAVAAHLDSEIMIMDEVLAVGDEKFQAKCLAKMKEVAETENKTIIYVSHNMSTIQKLCNRCLVLNKGKLIFDGKVDDAIRLYRGENIRTETSINLEKYLRPGWLGRDDIRMIYAQYKNAKSCVFSEPKIAIEIRLRANANVDNVGLRIEVMAKEKTPFATAVLYDWCNVKEREIVETEMILDVQHVMDGKYRTYYTVFTIDSYGNSVDLDCVQGLDIVINHKNKEKMKWINASWGNIQLPQIKVIGRKECKR